MGLRTRRGRSRKGAAYGGNGDGPTAACGPGVAAWSGLLPARRVALRVEHEDGYLGFFI
jgi:hypothetical protein